MAVFNFDDLQEESFVSGLAGTKIFLYGCNDCGKTKQATKLPKPFLIMTEAGGSAVKCPKTPCSSWTKFTQIVDDITKEKNLEKRQQQINTVIIDTAENLVDLSERQVCQEFGVRDLSEITGRQNGYKIARTNFALQIAKLTSVGYCVVFIAHEETVELTDELSGETYPFVQPKGSSNEKSSMRQLRDLCDFCIYLKPMGIDVETMKTIPSMAICRRTKNVFARSRFNIDTFINPFTAQGLVNAIEKAVERSAEEEDAMLTTFTRKDENMSVDDYFTMIKPYLSALVPISAEDVKLIIETELGAGKKITEATEKDKSALDNIYNQLVSKALMMGIEV